MVRAAMVGMVAGHGKHGRGGHGRHGRGAW